MVAPEEARTLEHVHPVMEHVTEVVDESGEYLSLRDGRKSHHGDEGQGGEPHDDGVHGITARM